MSQLLQRLIRRETVAVEEIQSDGFRLGKPDAPITVTAYIDYECQYCEQHHKDVMPKLVRDHVSSGWINYQVKPFPLDVDGLSMKKAKAAFCLSKINRLWDVQTRLYSSDSMKGSLFDRALSSQEESKYKKCYRSDDTRSNIMQIKQTGEDEGISATPTFMINGDVSRGLMTANDWENKFHRAIKN